jgi:hypothetical protein
MSFEKEKKVPTKTIVKNISDKLKEWGRRNQKKEQRKIEAVRKKEKRSRGRNPERSRTTC